MCSVYTIAILVVIYKTATFLYGLAVHSTWILEAPICLRCGDGSQLTGGVLR